MTKAKKPEPILIDLEFEATSTAIKNHAQKDQGKPVDNPTIAFNLDEDFFNTKKQEQNADNVLDLNNIAKTQKEEIEEPFKGFDISMDDLHSVGDVHDKTQATVLFNPAMLKEAEKAKKVEAEVHKLPTRNAPKEKTDSRINIKVKPLGLKQTETKKAKNNDESVDLNLLDNLDMVEGLDPSSLTSEFNLKELNNPEPMAASAMIQEENLNNFSEEETAESAIDLGEDYQATFEKTGKLDLPTDDSIDLNNRESDAPSKIIVAAKGNELELGEMSSVFEMEMGNEGAQPSEVGIASSVMNNMIHMDDLTQEFQIENEKHFLKAEMPADVEESFEFESEENIVDENSLEASLFSGEKEPSDPKLDFTQSEVLAKAHEKELEKELENELENEFEDKLEETKEFSLEEAMEAGEEGHDTFSLSNEEDSFASEMPAIPEDAFVTGTKEIRPSSEKEDFYKQIQKYREEKEKVIIEESNVGSMIRELREDRDRLLEQVTQISAQFKEQEQMLLTLRANLEESKIENSILKKRQSKEFDEAKYQVEVYEDRMNQAIETAKIAEEKVVKLQQSIRIDFNQVKQREKELESKLELLMMDFDAQVKSRDQKILDLRRKVDSLEFNLESTNLREQKTIDEKKRVEDRLTKIMKTLKHSLHTLEDEVDAPLAKTGNKKR